MAKVDPDDDTVRRLVLQHHRYDDDRNERRRVTVEAFDDRDELEVARKLLQASIEQRRRDGEPVDASELATGTVLEQGELPGNITLLTFDQEVSVQDE